MAVSELVAILAVAVLMLTVLVVSLLRSHAEILRALHDLGVTLDPARPAGPATFDLRERREAAPTAGGRPEPKPGPLSAVFDLMGESPDGEVMAVAVGGTGQPTLLAFLSSGCGTCRDFWSAIGSGETISLSGRDARVVAVTRGFDSESPSAVAEVSGPTLTTVMTTEAFEDYGVPAAPYFVLIDGDQVVGEGTATSWIQLRDLLGKAVADGAHGRSRREVLSGRLRTAKVDAELSAAGIGPDHPSLRPDDPS
jgi:hypothetical protein